MTKGLEKILEHHRDKRLIFDDKDGTGEGHGVGLKHFGRL
jgi:hypothetical protein